ncbi:MAG: hypothetical protein KTR29_22030 [Rhodothermaceae bacterium]|nr:hypothetical protein [Rhodothermaceae bacterium]
MNRTVAARTPRSTGTFLQGVSFFGLVMRILEAGLWSPETIVRGPENASV